MKRILPLGFVLLALAGCQTAPHTATPPPAASVAADRFWPADGQFDAKGKTSSWPGFRAKNVERRTEFAAHIQQDQNALVFVGDSITEGWHDTLFTAFSGLHVKLANRGIGGDTTPNLLYRFRDDVLALHPVGMVVLIGTNDLGEHTSPEDIADNLHRLHAMLPPRIPIAWCLVMPRKGDDDYPARIQRLNTLIRQEAATDSRITVVDTFTPLAQPDGTSKPEDFNADRLHLNAEGYRVWASALEPVLSSWQLH